MENKYGELKVNTIIIAIANIGSKAIAFILAPLYSYYLTTEQYGTMDLITSTAALLVPFICFDIYEATFRFSSDKQYDEKRVFSSSMAVLVPGSIIFLLVIVTSLLLNDNSYLIIYTGFYVLLDALNNVMSQFLRSRNQMKSFALTGVINSIIVFLMNLLFLVYLKNGLNGWLVSFLLGKIAVTFYLFYSVRIFKNFSFAYVDKAYIKRFLKFCAPLVPTAIMWWIMNVSDRYMITFFIGTAATGIYSVATKLPSILSVFENIFYQAWQTTAINTLDDVDRDKFYSTIFNNYIIILGIAILGILIVAKPMVLFLFAENYASAWICMAPLILGVLFHALSGNLGALYSVFKNTKGAFYSTMVGAVANIILNIIFIPIWGITGAALTTLIGYIVTLLYRWRDIKQFVDLKLDYKNLLPYFILIPIQLTLYYVPGISSYILRIIILLLVFNKKRDLLFKLLRR